MKEPISNQLLEWGKEIILALLVFIGSIGVQTLRDIREQLSVVIRESSAHEKRIDKGEFRLDNHEGRIIDLEHFKDRMKR